MIKHSYATEDEIPEAMRSHYEKGADGKWYLQVEGMVPKVKHDEFRDKNIDLQKQLDAERKKTEGLNLDRAKELLQLDADGKIKTAENTASVEEQIAQRTKTMKEDADRRVAQLNDEHKKTVDELTKKTESTAKRLERVLIDDAITQAAVKRGALPTAIDDIRNRARSIFKLEDDRIMAYDSQGKEIYGKDMTSPLSTEEFTEKLLSEAPHLFQPNRGSGAAGGNKGGREPDVKGNPFKTGNLTDQGRLAKSDPQRYERLKNEHTASQNVQ